MTNFDNLKCTDGDFLDIEKLTDMIYENEGFFTQKEQSMSFDLDGKDVIVNYEIYIEGDINEESGDYFTPSSFDVQLTDVDVTINEVLINGQLVNLDKNDLLKVESLLKESL